ncbi:hypothetical protein BKA62DRAFT_303962 [Auriculariales sp. MPI-PUGE-AT-0066]|nr:hypothetical protein BKA62DRAFT_303962 [Auriculariales sp. MPI-PUGE-AT-0066]
MKKAAIRQLLLQSLSFVSYMASGLMIYKGLGLLCNCGSPIVVVLSASMEPAMARGDLLLLTNHAGAPNMIGDITIYNVPAGNGSETPIVHRVLEIHTEPKTQTRAIMTKGDNNQVNDLGLYNGQPWLQEKDIIGKVRAYMPYVGYATIAMNDFPWLKYALMGGLGLLAVIQQE